MDQCFLVHIIWGFWSNLEVSLVQAEIGFWLGFEGCCGTPRGDLGAAAGTEKCLNRSPEGTENLYR